MSKIFVSLSSLLVLLFFSFFIIQEHERGILLRPDNFLNNNTNHKIICMPGLHFKWPILDTVIILDARMHTINNIKEHFITKEKKDLFLNYYVKWKIVDFIRYYHIIKEKNFSQIELFLKQKIDNELQLYISSLNIKDIISSSDTELSDYMTNIEKNKKSDLNKFSLSFIKSIQELGIQLVDIRIQNIALPDIMYNVVYNRMQADQKAIAHNKNMQKKELIQKIHSIINNEMSIVLAEAEKKALFIKGSGEAKVIQLFAKNFGQEPDFYFFVRSLHLYENVFKNNKNFIFIDLNNKLFKHLNKINHIIK